MKQLTRFPNLSDKLQQILGHSNGTNIKVTNWSLTTFIRPSEKKYIVVNQELSY